jgi:DNA-binding MarR family transcriptional regulator
MGRGIASAPLDVQVVQQAFALRQDGSLVRRQCRIDAFNGEPATFIGPGGKRMVRISVQGKVRRVLATRAAWALAKHEWPTGLVKPKNGDSSDLREANLIEVRHGAHQPQANGGRASSLERRQAVNAALLNALAERANPTLAELSEAVGLSEGRVSMRLGRLAERGLTASPMCVPGRAWALTEEGRKLAEAGSRGPLDDLDRQVLRLIALAPMRQLQLVRETETCSLTIKRRTGLLIGRGLAVRDEMKRFSITDEGRKALGDAVPPRWVRLEAVSAALAKDVAERHGAALDDRTQAQKSAHLSLARGRPHGAGRRIFERLSPDWSQAS